jgi:membrane protease YdiL (CAAX protease family)
MWVVLPYTIPLAIIIIANLGVARRGWRWVTYILLAMLNAAAFMLGLLLAIAPYLTRLAATTGASTALPDTGLLGLALVLVSILGFLCLLPPVLRFLARFLSIDPASPVHVTALVFVIYLIATSASLLFIEPELMAASVGGAGGLGAGALAGGEAMLVALALAGVGLGTRRSLAQLLDRLGLRRPNVRHLALAAMAIVAFLALDYCVSWLWLRLWPDNYRMVAEISRNLFAPFSSPAGALMLGLSAGVGEETLFRGALQPRFRILLTAVAFTVGHIQYTLSPALVEILLVGLALGWLREKTSTTNCIIVHTLYNSLTLLLMPYYP